MNKKLELDELVRVESSNIDMVGFNDSTKETFVQFKNGTIYSYIDTSKEEFEQLAYAKSVGGHFAQSYRYKEDYSKLEDVELIKIESKQEKIMTDMNTFNLMTKKLTEDTAEYYRADLRKLSPKNRAKFCYFKTIAEDYEFANDDLMQLEAGELPENMNVNLDIFE